MSHQSKQILTLYAPAKINLGLEITGVFNNYHLLNSIVFRINLYDTIQITLDTDKVRIVEHEQSWNMLDDIAYKAAILLKAYYCVKSGVSIKIIKKIPIGGGMGGGSSDAASVLLGLNQLWNINVSKNELANIGAKLGCDIPFFIHETTAVMNGFGEKITPLYLQRHYFVIFYSEQISTKEIFRKFNEEKIGYTTPSTVDGMLEHPANSLESTARNIYSKIDELFIYLEELSQKKVYMTGSGSTLFIYSKNISEIVNIATKCNTSYYYSL